MKISVVIKITAIISSTPLNTPTVYETYNQEKKIAIYDSLEEAYQESLYPKYAGPTYKPDDILIVITPI